MIIGRRVIYREGWTAALKGQIVEIVSIQRGRFVLRRDDEIDAILDDDIVEVCAVVGGRTMATRFAATAQHLEL